MPRIRLILIAATLAAACADEPTSLRPARPRADEAPAGVVVPDSIPAWVYDDSSVATLDDLGGARTLRHAVLVLFRNDATAEQRAEAIARVGGEVVGGRRLFGEGGDGLYVVRVPGDPLGAADALAALPPVQAASPELMGPGGDDWLAPRDDARVGRWTASPDSSTADANWAFERVGAPLAWGCATGDRRTTVAVVDRGFAAVPDVAANATDFPAERPDVGAHGTMVSSIVGARGDDGVGMAGMMWYADLRLVSRADPAVPARTTALAADASALAAAIATGARVVNLSGSLAPAPADAPAAARLAPYHARAVGLLAAVLRRAEWASGAQPLYVFSAGNDASGSDGGGDARWNTFPALRDSFPDRVLVVAASGADDAPLATSRRGPLVEIAAPGDAVLALDSAGALGTGSATSAAAALVSGAAGLLFAFDPSLDAARVKAHLLDGARAGGRTAGDYPVLNAYAALQQGATRDGAPLCGQRLWFDGSALVIERDSATGRVETVPLGLADESVRFVVPADGGREIFYYHQHDDTREWAVGRATLGADEQWVVTADATDAWEALAGSLGRLRLTATRAFGWGGTTRGGDSTVWVEPTYAAGSDFGSPFTVRQPWSVAVRGAGRLGGLALWVGSAMMDDAPGQGARVGTIPLGSWAPDAALAVTAVFDGPGDHVYAAVSADGDSAGARVYRFATAPADTAAAQAEPLPGFPAGRDVTHLAASDDGRQIGVTFSAAPGVCAIEYRDARRFDRVLRAVTLPYAACATSAAPNFAPRKTPRRRR